MDLLASVLHIHPDARPGVDFTLRDDSNGQGPYIASWTYAGATQPSQTDLQNAWTAVQAQPAPPPPPDVAGFLKAIPLDVKLTTSATEAIVTSGAGQLGLQALTLGDFSHFQSRYNDLKASPPAPAVLADVQEIGNLAVTYHIPLTV